MEQTVHVYQRWGQFWPLLQKIKHFYFPIAFQLWLLILICYSSLNFVIIHIHIWLYRTFGNVCKIIRLEHYTITRWQLMFSVGRYLTNRFHFAVRLYSDNAQMTSKRGENKEVGYEPQASSVTDVLTTFWRPLCVIRVQTHGKMESICFIQ